MIQLNHYEYPFHPSIGGNVGKLLFEPISDITGNAMTKELTNIIKNYEPRFTTYYVKATPNADQDGYDILIEGFINNSTQPIAITTFLERLP